MKWLRCVYRDVEYFGTKDGDEVLLSESTWSDVLAGKPANWTGRVPGDAVEILCPVKDPGKIIGIGLNYRDHCRETGLEIPSSPLIFAKFTSSLNHPNGEIVWSDSLVKQVDYEGELAVVIGRRAQGVTLHDAMDYVGGYTAANDVSARDLQFADGQWTRGKSLDSFCPLGPVFVTADDIPDPQNLSIRCSVNGKLLQNSRTSEMIFGVAELVSYCSHAFTLEPGDVILTGTPHGVGMAQQPQIWLRQGDLVVVEVEGIGRLQNVCRVQP